MKDIWLMIVNDDAEGKALAAARSALRGGSFGPDCDEEELSRQTLMRFWDWWQARDFQPKFPPYEMLPSIARNIVVTHFRRSAVMKRAWGKVSESVDTNHPASRTKVNCLLCEAYRVVLPLPVDQVRLLAYWVFHPEATQQDMAQALGLSRKQLRRLMTRARSSLGKLGWSDSFVDWKYMEGLRQAVWLVGTFQHNLDLECTEAEYPPVQFD